MKPDHNIDRITTLCTALQSLVDDRPVEHDAKAWRTAERIIRELGVLTKNHARYKVDEAQIWVSACIGPKREQGYEPDRLKLHARQAISNVVMAARSGM